MAELSKRLKVKLPIMIITQRTVPCVIQRTVPCVIPCVIWAYNIVTSYTDLVAYLSDVRYEPNYYSQIFDYCIDELKYDVNVEFFNGETCELKNIRDALKLEE